MASYEPTIRHQRIRLLRREWNDEDLLRADPALQGYATVWDYPLNWRASRPAAPVPLGAAAGWTRRPGGARSQARPASMGVAPLSKPGLRALSVQGRPHLPDAVQRPAARVRDCHDGKRCAERRSRVSATDMPDDPAVWCPHCGVSLDGPDLSFT
jgi:hypothetical protein